jgi:tRNA splicing ligase
VNLIGKDIIMTEKLDGENNGITKHGVYARSHAEFTKNPWSVKVRQLHSIIGMDIPENVFLFGEGMEAIHSIEYTKLTSPFYLFGIRENDIWWSWNDVEDWAHLLNIPTVPVLFRGKVKSEEELNYLIKTFMENGSMIGGDIEGVVVRTSSEFTDDTFDLNVQKYVRENHVQTTTHWTRNWVKANIQQEYK